jgi:hypothetical protein
MADELPKLENETVSERRARREHHREAREQEYDGRPKVENEYDPDPLLTRLILYHGNSRPDLFVGSAPPPRDAADAGSSD